jgi:hypothetical protein
VTGRISSEKLKTRSLCLEPLEAGWASRKAHPDTSKEVHGQKLFPRNLSGL